LAFSQAGRFHGDYDVVFNTAEDILRWMGFEVRYRNPRTGRLLCHGERESAGATGYLEVTVTGGRDQILVRGETGSYGIWGNRRLRSLMAWFFRNMDAWMGREGKPGARPVMYGHRATTPFRPSPDTGTPRDVLRFDPPSRTAPALIALVPVLTMVGLASFQVDSPEDLLVVLAFVSPFIAGSLLIAAGFFRVGGALCIVFGVFAGIAFGIFAWLVVFGFGQYAGDVAMRNGRWSVYHKQMEEEIEAAGA
jgi:hypothetical protein